MSIVLQMFNHRWQEKLLPASLGCIPGSQHVQKQRRTAPSWHEDYVNIGMLEAPISSFFGSSRWKVMLIPTGQRTWGSRVTLKVIPGINQLFVRNQDVIFHWWVLLVSLLLGAEVRIFLASQQSHVPLISVRGLQMEVVSDFQSLMFNHQLY